MKNINFEDDIEEMIELIEEDTSLNGFFDLLWEEIKTSWIGFCLSTPIMLFFPNLITQILTSLFLAGILFKAGLTTYSFIVVYLGKKAAKYQLKNLMPLLTSKQENIPTENLINSVRIKEIFTQEFKQKEECFPPYNALENNYFYFLDEKEKLHILQQQLYDEKEGRKTYSYDDEDILNTYIPNEVYQKLKLTYQNLPKKKF